MKTPSNRLPYIGVSPLLEYANSESPWFRRDSADNFAKNMQTSGSREKILSTGWTEENITYKFNSYGFRSDEFGGDGALFLGCSFTQGTGIDWERSWSYLASKELNLKCWNLGIGGGSNDTAFRLASYWIPQLKPKYVFYLPPFKARLEIITPERFHKYFPNMPMFNADGGVDFAFYNKWLSMDENGELNYDKNVRGVKSICMENNIPCITVEDDDRFINTYQDWGRDLVHHGPSWHKATADKFLSQIT